MNFMKQKKTYVVSVFVPITVNALVYAEVTAENKEQAIKDVKKNFDKFKLDDAILDDARIMLDENEVERGKISYTVDRASRYHSPKECQLCEGNGEK